MVGFLDISPATETVQGVIVGGVSARGVSYLLARYPQLRALMTGREVKITYDEILFLAPDAIGAIIAAGNGFVPDGTDDGTKKQAEAEAKASSLPVGVQMEFIEAILRVTMPGGVDPFVARLERLGEFAGDAYSKVPATNSPKPSLNSATDGS